MKTLISARDVMVMLACSRSYVQDHRAALGARKMNGLLRFDPADVERFVEAGRVAEPAPAEQPEPTPIRTDIDTTGLPEKNPLTGRGWPWSRPAKANR